MVRMLGMYLESLAMISPSLAARKGFQLFCRPFRTPTTPKQIAFFDSAHKFAFHHEGCDIQAYRWGSGPKKILFLHGWQSHSYRWKPYIEALAKDEYTLYAFDAPGHGLSSGSFLTVPLYSTLIEIFLRQHPDIHTVVGHSLGGFSLLYTFYREPALPVDRIILLAPPGEASDFISVFQSTLKISNRTVQLVIRHFAERYRVTPDFFSSLKFAPRLKVKGLIIHDEDDLEAPYRYAVPLNKHWPSSKLVTTKGLGHNLKSQLVVKEVVNFIGEPVMHPSVASA